MLCFSGVFRWDGWPVVAEEPQREGDWSKALRDLSPLLSLGSTLAITVGLGVLGGYAVDRWLGTKPFGLLIGGLLALAVALYGFVKTVSGIKR
jgi:F0F1-type ATP synthase assembly protein I